ncbi:MAG: ribosome maturation factor RimP [SAR324 cluster bacterium]|nr:ribosome maturation factor RimP [SAR324 cluster bacterium]
MEAVKQFMLLSENLSNTLTELIQPLAQISGLELVEIALKQGDGYTILDVVIDKSGGVTIDDCATLSKKISLTLDIEDLIPFKYHLEVGSPGIFRKLKSDKEIENHVHERVKAVFFEPVSGHLKFVGTLVRFQDQKVFIQKESEELVADLQQIKSIQLFPDI